MSASSFTHSEKLNYLNKLYEKQGLLGKSFGALFFLVERFEKLTFLQPANTVFADITAVKSKKYLQLKKQYSLLPKLTLEQELDHFLQVVALVKSVQLSQTYISLVRYLVEKIASFNEKQFALFLLHVRNVTLLTANDELLLLLRNHSGLLEQLEFPAAIIKKFPSELPTQLFAKPSLASQVFDLQNHPSLAELSVDNFPTGLSLQQLTGLRINKACLQRDSASYLAAFNDLFAQYKLSGIASMTLNSANVLTSLRYKPLPAIKKHSELVTVIMSCFNAVSTIEYAVSSILGQTHTNFELLICDDSSDDGTLNKLLDLAEADSRITVFKSVKNQGTYNIRNALLAYAKGVYVTFQDSDDFAHPQRLSEQVNHIKEKALLVSSTRWLRIVPNGQLVFFVDGLCVRFCVVSTMLHRSVFHIIPKFRSSLVAADTEFHENCIMLLGEDKVGILDKPLILGLWGDASLTKTADLNAENDGYVAEKRRKYSEIAARQRMLGAAIVTDEDVEHVLRELGIYREYFGVTMLTGN